MDGKKRLYISLLVFFGVFFIGVFGFKNESLRHLTGKTLAQVAGMRGKSPEETAIDLVIEDDSRVTTIYFLMSEENVKKQIKLPWSVFVPTPVHLPRWGSS